MFKRKRIKALPARLGRAALALALALAASGALAFGWGKIVFDPSNFMRNSVTAYQSVVAESQRYTQILYEMRQLEAAYRNLNPASAGLLESQVARNAALAPLYEEYVRALSGTAAALGGSRSFLEQLRASYAASNLPLDAWADRQAELIKQKDARALSLYQMGAAVLDRLRDALAARNDIYRRIESAGGALEISQTTAAVLAQVEANTADMNALWAGMAQRSAEEAAQRNAEEERYRAWRKEFEENRRRQDEAAKRVWTR